VSKSATIDFREIISFVTCGLRGFGVTVADQQSSKYAKHSFHNSHAFIPCHKLLLFCQERYVVCSLHFDPNERVLHRSCYPPRYYLQVGVVPHIFPNSEQWTSLQSQDTIAASPCTKPSSHIIPPYVSTVLTCKIISYHFPSRMDQAWSFSVGLQILRWQPVI
jgi:hypothetical protein